MITVPDPTGKKKRNALSAVGNFLMGGATAKDFANPAFLAKGMARAANDNLIQPLYRTGSGQNLRTALAPSSTINQRINAVGEDALNVIGMVPLAGPIARGSIAAEKAGALALARAKGVKPTAPKPPTNQPSSRASQQIQQSTVAQKEALDKARTALQLGRPEYDFNKEGFIRLWHTSANDGRLPFPLQDVKKSVDLDIRRGGSGGGQLLDGGLYTTDSGAVSATYGSQGRTFPLSYHLPEEFQDKAVDFRAIQTDFMYDKQRAVKETEKYSADLLDSARSIDDAISAKDMKNLIHVKGVPMSTFQGAKTYRDILDAVDPAHYDDLLKELEAPLKFSSDNPTVLNINTRTGRQNLYADKDNPLYFIGTHPTSIFGPRVRAASRDKRLLEVPRLQQIGLEMEDTIKHYKSVEKLYKGDLDPVDDPRILTDAFQGKSMSRFIETLEENLARHEEYIKTFMEPSLNDSYRVPAGFSSNPGQNYFDLPVERSSVPRPSPQVLAREQATRGFRPDQDNVVENIGEAITAIDGLPAFDIGNLSETQIENMRAALQKFFAQYPDANPGHMRESMEILDDYLFSINYPNADPEIAKKFKLDKFRTVISNAYQAIPVKRSPKSNDFTTTEDNKLALYDFLQKELGYSSMPHPGGVTMGGATPHQAVVFSRPELLPPSTYVPSSGVNFHAAMSKYNEAMVRKYYQQRNVAGLEKFTNIPQASPNITAAQRMASRMALASSAQSVRNR